MAERPSRVLMPAEVHRHPAGTLVLPPGVEITEAMVADESPLHWKRLRAFWASPPASRYLAQYHRERRSWRG